MSLVQIAYQTLITKIREWGRLQGKEQLQLLQQASCLFGQPFRKALNLIEKNSQKLQIYEYDHFYLLIINLQKYLLFKSNSKARLNDCTCRRKGAIYVFPPDCARIEPLPIPQQNEDIKNKLYWHCGISRVSLSH